MFLYKMIHIVHNNHPHNFVDRNRHNLLYKSQYMFPYILHMNSNNYFRNPSVHPYQILQIHLLCKKEQKTR